MDAAENSVTTVKWTIHFLHAGSALLQFEEEVPEWFDDSSAMAALGRALKAGGLTDTRSRTFVPTHAIRKVEWSIRVSPR